MSQSCQSERVKGMGSRRPGRTLVILALFAASFLGLRPPVPSGADPGVTPATVEAVVGDAIEGRGLRDRIGCVLCVGTIVGVGGGSIGGVLVLTAFFPETVAACGVLCILAF